MNSTNYYDYDGGGTMDKLIDKLCSLLKENRSELIDFDELTGTYSRKKVDAVAIQLDELQQAGHIQFIREDYGFRINLYDVEALKNFPTTAMVKEVIEDYTEPQ